MTPTDRLIQALRDHGIEPTRAGRGWTCRCPAHEDRKPSLSIAQGDRGGALVKCHAGCDTADVAAALGLKMADLMPTLGCAAKIGNAHRKPKADAKAPKCYPTASKAVEALERQHGPRAALWRYRNSKGKTVGVLVRWNTPQGKVIRPASKTPAGWIIGGMPPSRPLYRLPELLAMPGERIFVCEGEKCVCRARALGLLATTSPHGSQSAAQADWTPLAGRDVVILPDHDDAGERYAAAVAELVTKAGAKSVRIVRLPDLGDGGDIVDFAKARRAAGTDDAAIHAEVQALADQAPMVESQTPGQEEIDASRIVRPERFITAEVSGLAVPTVTAIAGKPAGRWVWYLHWADGRRVRCELTGEVELSHHGRLWIHPLPGEPTPNMAQTLCGWSVKARRAWVDRGNGPNPADLFKRLCEQIAYFLDLPQEHAPGTTATLALWVMLTYCYPAWDAVPYLYVGGPIGSGKSRLFEILSRLIFRPLLSSNMTAPSLFRTLHNQGGTLLFDEAERLKQTQTPEVGEILSMLLAGYKRGGQATRLEKAGEKYKSVAFDVYGPKALACIAGLPGPLLSRCISVMMFRASPDSPKPRRRIDADPAGWQSLRDDLHDLAMNHGPEFLELANRTDVCPAMSGRDFELWQPMMALAAWIENYGEHGLLQVVQNHARTTIEAGKDEQAPEADEILLRIIADNWRAGRHPTPKEILAKAQRVDFKGFEQWYPRAVTARLKAYGIPTPRKIGSRREFRDITRNILRRIQTNYGVDLELEEISGHAPAHVGIGSKRPKRPKRPMNPRKKPKDDGNRRR